MNPLTYALCQKPVIGAAMWIASLCAFPPLFADEPISLSTAGAAATRSFTVPVDKRYALAITFEFASAQARLADTIVGTRFDAGCESEADFEQLPEAHRAGLGRPMPFRVVIRKASDRSVFIDRTFVSRCLVSHDAATRKTRNIGGLELPRGDYTAEVTNLEAQPGLERVVARLMLHAGSAK